MGPSRPDRAPPARAAARSPRPAAHRRGRRATEGAEPFKTEHMKLGAKAGRRLRCLTKPLSGQRPPLGTSRASDHGSWRGYRTRGSTTTTGKKGEAEQQPDVAPSVGARP